MLTLKECVQKQHAKPVKATKDAFMVLYRCPRCAAGRVFKIGTEVMGNKTNYCSECGQKLDWSGI